MIEIKELKMTDLKKKVAESETKKALDEAYRIINEVYKK